MAKKTIQSVMKDYLMILEERKTHRDKFEAKDKILADTQTKIEEWLLASEEQIEVDTPFKETNPFVFWQVSNKTDADCVLAYRHIRDLVQANNAKANEYEDHLNGFKKIVGNYILNLLNERKQDSFNCGTGVGKAYRKLVLKASPEDFGSYLEWAVKEGCADEAVQKRVSNSFVSHYAEEHNGEYPPYLSVFKEYDVVVTK